jgi:hypothetical protein
MDVAAPRSSTQSPPGALERGLLAGAGGSISTWWLAVVAVCGGLLTAAVWPSRLCCWAMAVSRGFGAGLLHDIAFDAKQMKIAFCIARKIDLPQAGQEHLGGSCLAGIAGGPGPQAVCTGFGRPMYRGRALSSTIGEGEGFSLAVARETIPPESCGRPGGGETQSLHLVDGVD